MILIKKNDEILTVPLYGYLDPFEKEKLSCFGMYSLKRYDKKVKKTV